VRSVRWIPEKDFLCTIFLGLKNWDLTCCVLICICHLGFYSMCRWCIAIRIIEVLDFVHHRLEDGQSPKSQQLLIWHIVLEILILELSSFINNLNDSGASSFVTGQHCAMKCLVAEWLSGFDVHRYHLQWTNCCSALASTPALICVGVYANFGSETACCDERFSWLSSAPPCQDLSLLEMLTVTWLIKKFPLFCVEP
jgi:hypothetical protein